MKYDVVIIAEAEEELEEAYRFVREDSPTRAKRWRESLLARAKSLGAFPARCAIAPESFALGVEVRQLVVGNYRVLFTIDGSTVTVRHIRHAARRTMTE
jgi:plasmid stabilization system protein ParE